MARRKKVSTTISPESYAVLSGMIRAGQALNLAQALDLVLAEFRRAENRRKLERATAEYYANLTPEEIEEENRLGEIFSATAGEIDLDE
jgi:hypothetical protein